MTPERAKELLPIIKAFSEGKPVQYRISEGAPWLDDANLAFSGEGYYRIKPEKKKGWINIYKFRDVLTTHTTTGYSIYKTKEDAAGAEGPHDAIDCIEIEWEDNAD